MTSNFRGVDIFGRIYRFITTISFAVVCLTLYNVYYHPRRSFPGQKVSAISGLLLIFRASHFIASEASNHGLDSIWIQVCSGIVIFVSVAAFLSFSFRAVRNIYFHPLSSYPGARSAAASRFNGIWHRFRGTWHDYEHSIHMRYGDVVRSGPNTLSFTSEAAWRDIYGPRHGKQQFQKSVRQFKGPLNIMTAPDEEHARMRRALSHAFSEKALRDQESLIQSYIAKFVAQLRSDTRAGRVVNLVDQFNFLIFDLVSDLVFGAPFGVLESQTVHPWMKTFFKSFKESVMMSIMAGNPIFAPLLIILGGPMRQAQIQQFEYARQRVSERLNNKSQRPDFMSAVLNNNKKGLSRQELDTTFNVLMVAGTQTTVTTLVGCLYLLGSNPSPSKQLLEELNLAFHSALDITLPKVATLPYLSAVIQETLRIYPPVPSALPRHTPPEGAAIAGHWVPGGVSVGVPQRATNLSPANFAKPEEFHPERFLATSPQEFKDDRRRACQPFSVGPRSCIGKNLALAEIKLTLAHFLLTFEFDIVNNDSKWLEQKTFNVWQKKPLLVKLKERS